MKSQKHRLLGFSIVELMVVVAIIALVSAIALPSFMRARKRTAAVLILADMKALEEAKISYVVEHKLDAGDEVPWEAIRPLLKEGLKLAQQDTPKDRFGNLIEIGDAKATPKLSQDTIDELKEVAPTQQHFWAEYAP
jgi:prepilin-type N-terminal cleavage/methylation domain-containing protein